MSAKLKELSFFILSVSFAVISELSSAPVLIGASLNGCS